MIIINWKNNSLFAGSPDGAVTGCVLETIIQTGKMNDLEPSFYLQYLMNVVKQNRLNKLENIDFKRHLTCDLDNILEASLINKNISILPKDKRNMIYLPKTLPKNTKAAFKAFKRGVCTSFYAYNNMIIIFDLFLI